MPTYLKILLALNKLNSTLETITSPGNTFLYFENMAAEAKLLLKNLSAVIWPEIAVLTL
jgi:hypothetical protein